MKSRRKLSVNGKKCEISGPCIISEHPKKKKKQYPYDVWNWKFWTFFGSEIEVFWGGRRYGLPGSTGLL